jgi:asparagine synthase (glutamine-hydrolysing)
MCSIAGVVDRRGLDVGPMLKSMMHAQEHRGPDGSGVFLNGKIRKGESVEDIELDGLKGFRGLGHSRLKITGETGVQPLMDCTGKLYLVFNGEIWNYRELKKGLKKHELKTDSDSEVIIHLIEEEYNGSLKKAVDRATKRLDGDYAFAVADNDSIVLVRDPVGIKQLYYGVSDDLIAFASERTPLWKAGLTAMRLLPGDIIEIRDSVKIHPSLKMEMPKVKITDEQAALECYSQSLFDAVRKRIAGRDKVGVIFSGGIDSTLIAKVADVLGMKLTCYTAGLPESEDVKMARRAAEVLGLNLKVSALSEERIIELLPEVIKAIEDWNILQVEVAVPVFAAVRKASMDNMKVLLTGQGADELFAGYDWYPDVLRDEGEEGLQKAMWNDLMNLYKETLEREDKITMYHSIELRVPYLDPKVIDTAMKISPKLKTKKKDNIRKHLHRKMAEVVGTPDFLAWRPKDAAQHGSMVHETLEKAARSLGFHNLEVREGENTEKLGSVYRYKGEYGKAYVKLYLETLAYEQGAMPEDAKKAFEEKMGDELPDALELLKE